MSSRQALCAAVEACLSRIRTIDGYATDAGAHVTLEPGQVPNEQAAVIAVVIDRQTRPSTAAVVRTHRATTVAIVVKVPAAMDDAQARLDAIVGDVEKAMDDQRFRYPIGITTPQYQEMQPIAAEPGMGWIGAVFRYESNIPKF